MCLNINLLMTLTPIVWFSLFFRLNESSRKQLTTTLISHLQLDYCLSTNMANFRIMLLNILCGAMAFFAIVALQKSGGVLAFNAPSEIQEERSKKSLSTSFKTTLFSVLFASMQEKEVLTILCDLIILSKDILGIKWGPWYIKPRLLHQWELFITRL